MDYETQWLKHLEFIQAVITRQANNSFLVKGWSLTVSSAFYAFAAERDSCSLALLAIVPAITFAWLDAFFLRQERLFRALYADAAVHRTGGLSAMNPDRYKKVDPASQWSCVYRSRPLLALHTTIISVGLVLLLTMINEDWWSEAFEIAISLLETLIRLL